MHMIFCTVSNYVLAAGKKNPRNPTTKRSPRAPKLKEAEIGEGSFPGTARQLEYAPRVEPVINISTKKAFIQPPRRKLLFNLRSSAIHKRALDPK